MNRLANKIIIITGGGGLLGKAMVDHAKAEGATVINADVNLMDDLESGRMGCDVTDGDSVQHMIDEVLKRHGRIDGLVNNAYPRTQDWGLKFELIPAESWKQNVDLQLNSVFLCCQLVLKVMQTQKFGSVINISSIYGVVGPDFSIYDGTDMTMPAAYSAIKGGIVNFTRYLASYYGPSGIRVNCISPGGIFNEQNEIFVELYEKKVPMRRMGLPSDISPAVSFLLSDEASYISGHNLLIDGGWTCI